MRAVEQLQVSRFGDGGGLAGDDAKVCRGASQRRLNVQPDCQRLSNR
jgi:hypothetical protein